MHINFSDIYIMYENMIIYVCKIVMSSTLKTMSPRAGNHVFKKFCSTMGLALYGLMVGSAFTQVKKGGLIHGRQTRCEST